MQALKITNPNFLRNLSKQIESFSDQLAIPCITHQSLWSYYAESIARGAVQKAQFGMEIEEFWAVMSGDLTMENPDDLPQCHAFSHWYKMPLPYIGTVYCDSIYSWNRKAEPAQLLYQEFVNFGKRTRSVFYMADCATESLFRLFGQNLKKYGIEIVKTGRIQFIGRS